MFALALSFLGTVTAEPGNSTTLCRKLLAAPCSDAGITQFPAVLTETECINYLDALATAAGWTPGDDSNTTGNSFGCRIHYANLATATNKGPCRYAGISGGGVCGNDPVDNACFSIRQSCASTPNVFQYADQQACKTELGPRAPWIGSKQGLAAGSEDTIECRIYHALVGWNKGTPDVATDFHCNHTLVAGPCSGGPVTTDAEHYCRIHETTCGYAGSGAYPQYNNWGDCIASFNTFADANVTNVDGNNRGCRQYHLNAAALGVAPGLVHCTHGGPSGGNACGTSYQALATLANNAFCAGNSNFSWVGPSLIGAVNTFNDSDLAAIIPGTSATYNVSSTAITGGDHSSCRIYHATVAAGGAAIHCDHPAIPSVACFDGAQANPVAPICRMIWAGCGTSSNYTDVNQCIQMLAPVAQNKSGSPRDNNGQPNTDTLACRAFQAALAVSAKRAGNSTLVAAACANVKVAAGPQCGMMMAPTAGPPGKSGAAVVAVSASLALPLLFL